MPLTNLLFSSLRFGAVALALASAPLSTQAELSTSIDTYGGELGIDRDEEWGNERVWINGKQTSIEDGFVFIRKIIKLDKTEFILLETDCGGNSCHGQMYYLLSSTKKNGLRILAGPEVGFPGAVMKKEGKKILLKIDYRDGRTQITKNFECDAQGELVKSDIVETKPQLPVITDFADLQKPGTPVVAAVLYPPVAEYLKKLDVFDKEVQVLDPIDEDLVKNGSSLVETNLNGGHAAGWHLLYIKVWKNNDFFILREPSENEAIGCYVVYSNLKKEKLDKELMDVLLDLPEDREATVRVNNGVQFQIPIPR